MARTVPLSDHPEGQSMATDRIDIDHETMRKIERSEDVLRLLVEHGELIMRAAGPGHGIHAEIGRTRARVSVYTETVEAMLDEATNHNLLRALDAGR
jgi:hypothetical protein